MGEVNKQESNVGHKFEPDDVVFIKQDVLRGIWGGTD